MTCYWIVANNLVNPAISGVASAPIAREVRSHGSLVLQQL
jgi:hypothetical protein